MAAEVMDELNASLVRLHPRVFNDLVDQVVLAVPEPAHRFDLWGIVWMSLRGAGCRVMRGSRERRRSGAYHPHTAGSPWRYRRDEMLRLSASHSFEGTRQTSVSNTPHVCWRCPLSHRRGQEGRRRTGHD